MRVRMVGILVLVLVVVAASGLEARKKLLGEGEGVFKTIDLKGLPEFSFTGDLTAREREYLGLAAEGPFTLGDVKADLLIVEFLNVYCYACVQQAPIMNEIHLKLGAREDLHDRVRFLGIGIGNSTAEIAKFKSRLDVTLPVISDRMFESLLAIGNPGGTPFIVLFKPGEPARSLAHMGLWAVPDTFVKAVDDFLAIEPGAASDAAPEFKLSTWRNLPPPFSDEEVRAKIAISAAEAGLTVEKMDKVDVEGEENVYRLAGADGKVLWAKVAGRAKVCNICHDIYFILLFDGEGKVVNFTPIHVTKYKNEPINEEETAFMQKRVQGRALSEQIVFDHEVDAISQATISSELIFDTMRRLGGAMEKIKEAGE